MRILVWATQVPTKNGLKKAGIGRVTLQYVLQALSTPDEHHYTVIVPEAFELPTDFQIAANVQLIKLPIKNSLVRNWLDYFKSGSYAKKYNADAVFYTTAPACIFHQAPSICTIHDAFIKSNPEAFSRKQYYLNLWAQLAAVKRSDRILTVSEFSKREIARHFRFNAEKIDVALNGPGNAIRCMSDDDIAAAGWNDTHLAPQGYLIFVSTLEPRKNLLRGVQGFARFLEQHPESGMKLIVVGSKGWKDHEVSAPIEALGLGDRVQFLGYVSDELLNALIQQSRGLLCVSLAEGFGLPVLEAMLGNTLCVSSNTSALVEIGENYPFYCDPLSVESIGNAISECVNASAAERQNRLELGASIAAPYTWTRNFEQVKRSLSKLMG
jgi:glycosyltransferase involved in cell wall biosynthesis